jgi:transposase InsO family protein
MCPANGVQCFVCQGYGHFARVCGNNAVKKKMYEIAVCDEDEPDIECESFYIPVIADVSSVNVSSDDWYETLRGECGDERFKLDSGADINVLSFQRYLGLGYDPKLITNKPNMKLHSYSGNIIPIKGISFMNWCYKNKVYKMKFAIADISCESVLGRDSCSELGLIKRIHTVNLSEFSDLFEGLGCLPGRYHIVVDESVPPVVSATRKVPIGLHDKLRQELDRMVQLGVIRKVNHPTRWVSALVIAAKKNGSLRICLDPRPLNCAVQRAHFQLPTINEIAAKLHGAQYFSVLDASSGFWTTQLDDESADLCTFGTPFGRYQYLRLPYGLNCASEVFHAKIKQLLENVDGVDSFIDDIICWGRTKSEHDERLNNLLKRAREINLKFNKDKCKLCVEEVTYLGHVFNKNGMKPDPEKIRAIKDMPSPNDKKSLERFLGAINYLSKFIPHYSEHIFPLTRLLKKESAWCWDTGHEVAFAKLKELVCNAPVLTLFDASQPVVVSVDASAVALGAALLQGGRPVEYASRTLTDTQTRYAQIEKEMLAILFACEKYHQYIYGQKNVLVETDHKPLESIFKKALNTIPVRLQRMMLRLQGYDLRVSYKPGKYMYIPDTLSRAPLPDLYDDSISKFVVYQVNQLISNVQMSEIKLKLVSDETAKDEDMCQLTEYINKGWPQHKSNVLEQLRPYWSFKDELHIISGVIFKNGLVIIPKSLRNQMLRVIHDGHQGIDRCKGRAREVLFWPGISRDIEMYVRRCDACQECQNAPARESMLPIPIPELPWYKVGTDIFEYRKQCFLILIDYYSGYIEVVQLKNITSMAVITVMKDNFARYGIPHTVISDNGTQYTSREFNRFKTEWGFEHVTSSPYYHQSNGKSERAVQIIKKMLMKSINSGTDFYLDLLSYRNTPRGNIGSPAQLLMGRRLNCRLPVHQSLLKPVSHDMQHYEELIKQQNKTKANYDKHCRNLSELGIGDDVIILDHASTTNKMRGRVVKKCNTPRSYIIKNRKGMEYRRNRRHLIKCEPGAPMPGEKFMPPPPPPLPTQGSIPPDVKSAPVPPVLQAQGSNPIASARPADAGQPYEPALTRNKARKMGIDINNLF